MGLRGEIRARKKFIRKNKRAILPALYSQLDEEQISYQIDQATGQPRLFTDKDFDRATYIWETVSGEYLKENYNK